MVRSDTSADQEARVDAVPPEDREPRVETSDAPRERPEPGDGDTTRPVFAGTGVYVGFIALLLTAIAITIFAAQNTDAVPVRFTVWEFETPLIVVVLVSAIVAALVTELIGTLWRHNRRRVRSERQELQRLRQQRSSGAAET